MTRLLRSIAAIVILAALAAGAYLLWKSYGAAATPSLMTAAVVRGDIEQTVLASGTLKPVKLVAVGAQVSGQITSVKVALGQSVKSGDVIAEIDSVTQENALRTTEAALANMKAQRQEKQATLKLNEQTLARQKQMVEKKTVSQADYDSAAAAVAVTQAQIAALDAQLQSGEVAIETARANLDYTRITAPTDGTVLSIVSQEGQTVNATQSTPTIVILGQLDRMTVRAEISEADVLKVKPGQEVWFTVLGEPDKRYEAALGSIEPAPESIRDDSSITTSSSTTSSSSSSEAIYYNGIFDVDNAEGRLRTYMTVQVNIVLGRVDNVLTIPSAALGSKASDGGWMVRVAGKDGEVSSRAVSIGLNNKVTAEVLDGLEEGEQVVTGEASAQTSSSGAQGPGGPPPMGL